MPQMRILQINHMPTSIDPRHVKRMKFMKSLFAHSFYLKKHDKKSDISGVVKHISKIDRFIETSAPAYPIKNIAKVDVAILRLAIFELFYERKQPAKVIIDEAIELAKEFGGEGSPGFINGVLGSLYKKLK